MVSRLMLTSADRLWAHICKYPSFDKIIRIPSQPHTYMYTGHINGYGNVHIHLTIGDKFNKDCYQRYIDDMKGRII